MLIIVSRFVFPLLFFTLFSVALPTVVFAQAVLENPQPGSF